MAVIDSKKLLPPSKPGGAIVDSQKPFLVPVSNILYKKDVNISQKLLKSADKETQESGGSLVVIKKKVLKIKDIINNTYLIKQSEDNRKTKEKQRQRRDEREKKLETKPSGKADFNNLPKVSLPGRSILDTIKRFLFFTFVGFLFNKYSEYLPKLVEFGKYIEPVTKFIDSFAKNAINGVINFIDFGYQAYDNVSKTIKNIGGKDAEKTFTEFSTQLNLLLNGAIAAAMLIASTAPRGPKGGAGAGRRGGDFAAGYAAGYASGLASGKGIRPGAGFTDPGRYRASGQARAGGFGLEQTRRGLSFEQSVAARKTTQTTATQVAKGAARFGIAKVPIIGALIGFIIDTVVFREKPSRAAAGAVGSAVGQGIGLALAGGTTFGLGAGVGLFAGGFLGDIIGKSLYDAFAGVKPEPTPAKAQGGQVTSGQSTVASSRRIKTQQAPRRKTYTPPKTQPGKDIGGKLKIEELYGKDEPEQRSALRALTKSSADLKKMNSMYGVTGGMLGAGIDMALGQKPDKKLARALGDMFGSVVTAAVDAELNSSFNSITKTIGMANGGVVPSREIGGGMSIGEKIGKYISNAFSIALESSAAKVLRNLNQELNLEGGADSGGPMGDIEYGPLPLNMTEKQAFATIYELAKKHNAAMPELVAGMAMNESDYLRSPLARQYNNPFGQTGTGTKGSTKIPGNSRTFAVYNSLSDAVKFHVEKWNNDSSLGKGAGTYANAVEGLKAILPTYDPGGNHPQYVKNVASILSTMGFDPQKKNPAVNLSTSALIQQRRPTAAGIIPGQQPQSVPGNIKDTGLKDSSGRPIRLKGIIADAFIDMAAAARKDGIDLGSGISNSFRDPQHNAAVGGVQGSRHLTGEAFDINWYSAAGKWIKNNAGRFGFKYNPYSSQSTHFDWVGGYTPQSIIRQRRQQAALQPQASIAPTPSSTSNLVASVQQNPSYSQGGVTVVHAVNNIVMPIVSV